SLSPFELRLPELKIVETAKVAAARDTVGEAFRRFYGEFVVRIRNNPDKKRFLYSVDHVEAGNRFSNVVRVVARVRPRRANGVEPDLSDGKTGYELDDRGEVVERCAAFLAGLSRTRHPTDVAALQLLREIAPEFMQNVTRKIELSPGILFNRAL